MRRNLLIPPMVEPVALTEAKAWLRIDGADEDEIVAGLILAARLFVEDWTRRKIIAQTWRLSLDAWPPGPAFELPLVPFRGLAGARVYDSAGASVAVPAAEYAVDPHPERARFVYLGAPPAPGRVWGGVEIDVVAGHGETAADAPAPLRQAIRMLIARWHESRGDPDSDAERPPADVAALLAPWRRGRLA